MNLDDIQTHSFFKDESTGDTWFVDWYHVKPVVSLVNTDSGYRRTMEVDDPLNKHMIPMDLPEGLEAELRKMIWRAVRGFER